MCIVIGFKLNRPFGFKTKLEAQWAEPVSLTFHSVLRKLINTEPFIGASYQISVHFAILGFRGEDFFLEI